MGHPTSERGGFGGEERRRSAATTAKSTENILKIASLVLTPTSLSLLSYDKDSYEQNEIVLLSLRCATEHLIRGGTFVTKVYRSADYNALMWVIKQFFKSVEACKPASSRSQSAEIFLVCQGYLAPSKIDDRLLDPRTVFEAVEDAGKQKAISVFDKDYTKHRRQRQGYDMDLDGTMRRLKSVTEFVNTDDPINMLSECNGFTFKEEEDRVYLGRKETTEEVKESCRDLKLLGKAEFKTLLQWRLKMVEFKVRSDEERSDCKSKYSLLT